MGFVNFGKLDWESRPQSATPTLCPKGAPPQKTHNVIFWKINRHVAAARVEKAIRRALHCTFD
jgi:hypothetical protein